MMEGPVSELPEFRMSPSNCNFDMAQLNHNQASQYNLKRPIDDPSKDLQQDIMDRREALKSHQGHRNIRNLKFYTESETRHMETALSEKKITPFSGKSYSG